MTTLTAQPNRIAQYWALTKPRVTQLAVFCAVIGMFLATPDLPDWRKVSSARWASGCWPAPPSPSTAWSSARSIRAWPHRPPPDGAGESRCADAGVLGRAGGLGMWVLYNLVNPLTMWLTFATFVGYAIIYTILKPATPQNIVIGGLSGAMPPALGWAAVANDVPMQAWVLVLIIFVWTPPHFWALAMYRRDDYAKSGLPMLPITHGME
jgi:protoheme IX farnesyltransferase